METSTKCGIFLRIPAYRKSIGINVLVLKMLKHSYVRQLYRNACCMSKSVGLSTQLERLNKKFVALEGANLRAIRQSLPVITSAGENCICWAVDFGRLIHL